MSARTRLHVSGPSSSLELPLTSGGLSLLVVAPRLLAQPVPSLSLLPRTSPIPAGALPAVGGASSVSLGPAAGVPFRLVLLQLSRALPVIQKQHKVSKKNNKRT